MDLPRRPPRTAHAVKTKASAPGLVQAQDVGVADDHDDDAQNRWDRQPPELHGQGIFEKIYYK